MADYTVGVAKKIESQRDAAGRWVPVYELQLAGFDKPVEVSKELWDQARVGHYLYLVSK